MIFKRAEHASHCTSEIKHGRPCADSNSLLQREREYAATQVLTARAAAGGAAPVLQGKHCRRKASCLCDICCTRIKCIVRLDVRIRQGTINLFQKHIVLSSSSLDCTMQVNTAQLAERKRQGRY
eukprot:1311722-Amphidinium_carterae.1